MQTRPTDPLADAIADRVLARLEPHLRSHNSDTRLLTVERAAEYLGRSAHSVRHLCGTGKLPVVRIDGRVFLDRLDLDRVITEAKQTEG